MAFEHALKHTLGIEGEFSDDKADSGGATRWGITEAVARAFGYRGEMKDLPLDFAKDIYRQKYWDLLHLDGVDELSPTIAIELFDTAVNIGPGFAGRALQRILNVMNREQADFQDIAVDGLIGPATITALFQFLGKRTPPKGERVMLAALNALQGAFYIKLAEERPKDEKFTFGWFDQRVV